jgi:hypothetical protein
VTSNAVFDSAPSWSPDGSRIAFERGPAGDDPGKDLWSMAADGTDQRPLAAAAGTQESPDWQPLPVAPPANAAVPPPSGATGPSRAAAPRLTLRLAQRQSPRTLRRRGLVVSIGCSAACRLDARLRRGRLTLGHARGSLRAAGARRLTIRLTARTRAALGSRQLA